MPLHFELKSNEMADLKKKNNRRKKTTTNESLNSHWLPANVAGRLTVLPANCKIHPHLAHDRVLISGPAHMSTLRCGNICGMLSKCSRKERRCGFSNRSSVDAAVSGRHCVFLCKSKSPLFGLQKVDAVWNHG